MDYRCFMRYKWEDFVIRKFWWVHGKRMTWYNTKYNRIGIFRQ